MQEKVTFENRAGQRLAGVLHRPDAGPPRAAALFAHCFTCTKNVRAAVHISEALARAGYQVLRFDFTGLGESEGDFAETGFSANVGDLLDAAQWMADHHGAPELLVGHSLGGTAVLAAAGRIDSARAVATIGAPAEAEHVLGLLADDLETIAREGSAEVRLAGRPFRIGSGFVEDVRSQSVRDGIARLRRALLVMHSPVDEVVSIDEASRIYLSARHPKSFIGLDGADHLLSDAADSAWAGRLLAGWADRYLSTRLPEPPPARHVADAVVVRGRTDEGFLVSVNAGGHRLLGDEPAAQGGSERGPTPYDYLGAALGTCTAMTLNYYARREGLPLEGVEVEVRHDRIHAEDCADCETQSGKVDRLSRRLRLEGTLDGPTRERLLKIADRCPVHKTLAGEIHLPTELAQG